MADVKRVLDEAGLHNPHVQEFVRQWFEHTGAARVEVVSAADDPRLIAESLESGEIVPAGEGLYYSRSYFKDTARSEERTIVASSDPADKGVYNNWRLTSDIRPIVEANMKGASAGKTMYVIPYLMSPPGSPLEKFGAGVQLTDHRTVVMHMIRMARVGPQLIEGLADPTMFVRAVHVTGDLPNLKQGTPDDQRYFVTIGDERTILHFGSSYGGNALLGKIAHGLRLAAYDAYKSQEFMSEQFMLIGIKDKVTGTTYHVCGGFPSASGKTNLAMMYPPEALSERYYVEFFGDDIVWLRVDPSDGRIYGMNPEYGVFGVVPNTNEVSNPCALDAIAPGTHALFTNVAYNEITHEVWWEGRTPDYPEDVAGWRDWKGELIADRPLERQRSRETADAWAHPNSRFTTSLANVPNASPDSADPLGVPIDAVIFGGRVKEREPLVRAITDLAEGVYDGLTLGAEATAAADGKAGVLRYDPMSMRPFMGAPEKDYAQLWLSTFGKAADLPIFAHVNWFQRDASGRFIWPGYRENLRVLLWLLDLRAGRVAGRQTPIGILPLREELNIEGLEIDDADLERLLSYDTDMWVQEMDAREAHLAQFPGLPEAIWTAHRRIAAQLADEAGAGA